MNTKSISSPERIESYLFLEGCCEEAIEFYQRSLGAEVLLLVRFKDHPDPFQSGACMPGSENKVMHASLRIGETTIMLSDGRCTGIPSFQGFALSLPVSTEAEADRLYSALAEGGQVLMPLGRTFYSPRFGMVTDRFGVMWMIIASA